MTNSDIFDRTFLMTLKSVYESPHSRAQKTVDHLRAMNIQFDPFFALDGSITGLETKHTYEIDNPGTGYKIGPKTVSMYLSHLMLWRVCEFIEGESFLILEDDVRFKPDWMEHFKFAQPYLPPTWDMLYIGSCCCMEPGRAKRVQGHLHRVTYALCTHAYAIRKKAIPVLNDACHKVYAGIDIAMCLHAIPKLECYAFLPRLADQFETNLMP